MSQVNWGKQLGLAFALVVLGFLAYWVEFKQKPQKEEAEQASKKIVQLKDVSVKSIQVVNGSQTFELICSDFEQKLCKPGDNSKWQLEQPRKLKADDSNVNAVLSAINNVAVSDTIDLSTETPEKRAQLLKDYGLDEAGRSRKEARRLVLATPNAPAKETTIWLGETHPIGEGIFSQVSGNESKVFVLPSHFRGNFEHDLTYWRDKKVLTLSGHEVAQFKLDSPKGKVEGTRKDGAWQLKSGAESVPGDLETIDSLLSGAAYLTARSFAADDKNSSAGRNALAGTSKAVSIEFTKEKPAEGEKPVLLTFFRKGKDKAAKVFATVSNLDPVFEVDSSNIDRFEKSAKDLRLTKLMTSMDRFTAKKLEFSSDKIYPAIVLENKDGKWMMQATPASSSSDAKAVEASNDKVQALLDRLTGNRIKDFVSAAKVPPGFEKGVSFILSDEKEPKKRHFIFWKSGDNLYARDMNQKSREALQVDNAVWEALPKDRDFFSSKPAATASPTSTPAAAK